MEAKDASRILGGFAKKGGSTSEKAIYDLAVVLMKLGLGTVNGCLDGFNMAYVRLMLTDQEAMENFCKEVGVDYWSSYAGVQ